MISLSFYSKVIHFFIFSFRMVFYLLCSKESGAHRLFRLGTRQNIICELGNEELDLGRGFANFWDISGSFVQRQKRIAIYHVKKFVKESQLWKQTLSILPDFLENWHFLSHFVWKSTKTLKLLRIFDEIFDVINGDPFLKLYKTSAIGLISSLTCLSSTGGWYEKPGG